MRSDAKARVVPQTLRETLGDDLCALIEGLTSGIRDIAPITSLSARRSSRASFRIALEDGSVVKGRRLDSRFEAERLTRLSRHLCLPLIPAVIAQHGTAVIEPWTEGRSLIDLSPTELQACGALLGSIHAARLLPSADADIAIAGRERQTRLADNLRRLITWRRVNQGLHARVLAAAEPVPAAPAIGLIHGDFCADNLVRTTDGTIVAVDNETLRFEAFDYDLARSWYRWPMDGAQREAFLDGYGSKRPTLDFQRHFSYWAICALVDSAVFRIGADIAGDDAVLQQLDRFVESRERA
jgi:thiamine kinase-like enzyme